MPAAAVIPAPIAYINVVVVKKLVVGSRRAAVGPNCFGTDAFGPCVFADFRAGALDRVSASSVCFVGFLRGLQGRRADRQFYFEKIRVLKAGLSRLNIRAWNNGIGSRSYFVGFREPT